MRLINCTTLKFEEFFDAHLPEYAILSHRWEDEEVSLKEMRKGRATDKKGFTKIQKFCNKVLEYGLSYGWVDTCCIDKTSSAELSEAINSMYRWYQRSKVCFAYLSDVSAKNHLADSVWFTRGWTLQELLAPREVEFFDTSWTSLGSKGLNAFDIAKITGIPKGIITGEHSPLNSSVAQRMSWAGSRVTTRDEDRAYCLLGLFDVNMALLYGEGDRAFQRLQKEIINASPDKTILLWNTKNARSDQLLATSPKDFCNSGNDVVKYITPFPKQSFDDPSLADQTFSEFSMTNYGLKLSTILLPWSLGIYIALPDCYVQSEDQDAKSIFKFWCAGFVVTPGVRKGEWTRLNCTTTHNGDPDLYRNTSLARIGAGSMSPLASQRTILISGFNDREIELHMPYGFTVLGRALPLLKKNSLFPFRPYMETLRQNSTFPVRAGSHTLAAVFALPEKSKYVMMMIGFNFFFDPLIILLGNHAVSRRQIPRRLFQEARVRVSATPSQSADEDLASDRELLGNAWNQCLNQDLLTRYNHRRLAENPDSEHEYYMKVYQCPRRNCPWEPWISDISMALKFQRVMCMAERNCLGWEFDMDHRRENTTSYGPESSDY